jgi:hypothetical protein
MHPTRAGKEEAVRYYYRETESRMNKSVAAVTAKKPGAQYNWTGPIIFYKRGGDGEYADMTLGDFRHVAGFLLNHPGRPGQEHHTFWDLVQKNMKLESITMRVIAGAGFMILIRLSASFRLVESLERAVFHAVDIALHDLTSSGPAVIRGIGLILWDVIVAVLLGIALVAVSFGLYGSLLACFIAAFTIFSRRIAK